MADADVSPNGNGTVRHRDTIIGWILGVAILAKLGLAICSFAGTPSDWTTVNETSHDLARLIEVLTVGYFAARGTK